MGDLLIQKRRKAQNGEDRAKQLGRGDGALDADDASDKRQQSHDIAQDDDHRFLFFMSGQRVADDAGHGQRSKQHVDQRENDHDDARRLQGGHIRFVHGKYLPLSYFVYRRPCPGPERPLTCNTLASEYYVYKKPFFL